MSVPHLVASAESLPETRERPAPFRRRALVRRALVLADLAGLSAAFIITVSIFGLSAEGEHARPLFALGVFFLSLPAWALLASLHGLYGHDEGRMGHSTVDDFVGVVHLVTVGAWLFFIGCWITEISYPRPGKLIAFWLIATLLITACRAVARSLCQRSRAYVQNTVIVGGGDVGQLVARKLQQHQEYGIRLVGLVDSDPKKRRADLPDLQLLGNLRRLPEIVSDLDIERVVIAFSNESDAQTAEVVRKLQGLNVQVDIIPRLYELVGPRVDLHTVEGFPLVGLPSARWNPGAMKVKRAMDVLGAVLGLVVLSPLFGYIAWRVHRSSPGPIFFRQTRLGLNMREFVAFKFRTMYVDTDDDEHRTYIEQTMTASAAIGTNGMYKLERNSSITPFGSWLRKTSLDELPQLINVLCGEMSLVGPRPCIPYETRFFRPHHFERFLLPQGLTGLWQVTARAHSSFGEALDMDVAYVRGWTLGLDLRLLFRTPLELMREGATA